MAKVTRDQLLNLHFSDPKNYPYGFARSGDFSISESKALARYGRLIFALVGGKIEASCDEDVSLLSAARGDKSPESPAERAWEKYQARINRPKAGSIYGKTKAAVSHSRSAANEAEDSSDIVADTEDVILEEGE